MEQDHSAAPAADSSDAGALFSTPEELLNLAKKFGENGRTFRDFTELTPESMEVFYMTAYNLYNGRKYEDAAKVFRLLCLLNHLEPKYWKGLAASRQNSEDHEGALEAYGYLTLLDVHDPYPPFHGAKCLLALGRTEEAESGLRAAMVNSSGKEELADLHQQAADLLEVIEKGKQTIKESAQ